MTLRAARGSRAADGIIRCLSGPATRSASLAHHSWRNTRQGGVSELLGDANAPYPFVDPINVLGASFRGSFEDLHPGRLMQANVMLICARE